MRVAQQHANSLLLGSFSGPCLVLLKDPLDIPNGFILRQFDPLCMRIRVETLGTEFHLQTNPQNMTTKHYDTLGQLRLVSERLGSLTSKHHQISFAAYKHC